ncbi:hypothetical protein GGQ97_002658 [Sphingomonas kaistensis]|uniref:Uncharacterized protein n=1 Tax=Sphingomonas kaistensis TaxID=298708 RepID=A0A7X5YAI7_9SPHN|nr:hypothetical protein [Sphingomonas kaistensis]NJC06865.1 hypothetical protein [Sphingomonas kaistensis]
MLEPVVTKAGARFEYLGPIGTAAQAELGPVGQVLDTVDIWLAGTLQSLFNLIKR